MSNTQNIPDFALKHRVVGAAVLLFLGALVIPWILGPPTKSVDNSVDIVKTVELDKHEIVEELPQVEQQERVYISRITPLSSSPETEFDEWSNPTESDIDKRNDDQSVAEPLAPDLMSSQSKKADIANISTGNSADQVIPEAKGQSKMEQNTETGWQVQVGVFVDKSGVKKLMTDLRTRGFKPSATIVDTNRGKGTRVWLGPYEKRIAALEAKKALADKTGQSGFIRTFP